MSLLKRSVCLGAIAIAAQYGTGPEKAEIVVRAARSTMCTQAPG